MKAVILGYGSAGKRHADILRKLRGRDINFIIADPLCELPARDGRSVFYRDWHAALDDHADTSDFVIVASPTSEHMAQLQQCIDAGIWTLCEKPIAPAGMEISISGPLDKIAINFQFRYHSSIKKMATRIRRCGRAHFFGEDNLTARYGKDVAGMMAAHPIDTACWLFGIPLATHMISDGVAISGWVEHDRGISSYSFRMDHCPRTSFVEFGGTCITLPANRDMYSNLMRAFINCVETGVQDGYLPMFADGLRVQGVLNSLERTPVKGISWGDPK